MTSYSFWDGGGQEGQPCGERSRSALLRRPLRTGSGARADLIIARGRCTANSSSIHTEGWQHYGDYLIDVKVIRMTGVQEVRVVQVQL